MSADWNVPEHIERFKHSLFPYSRQRIANLESTRFCHYTSAEAALSILRSNQVWLRNARVMNDFSEVQHGHSCILNAWNDKVVGGRLKALLNRMKSGLDTDVATAYDAREHDRSQESYILSISEHDGGNEDRFGRLSMWRAYGGNTNVAFVFNNRPFVSSSDALRAYTSPVLYKNPDEFKEVFLDLVVSLENNEQLIRQFPPEYIVSSLVTALHYAALSTKHPGFSEEKEWRVIYSPTISRSDKIIEGTEVLGGVPQKIFKIPFINHPDQGLVGVTIPELLDRIIIGPTQFPWPIWDTFVARLAEIGVPEPEQKVVVSDIPLRR